MLSLFSILPLSTPLPSHQADCFPPLRPHLLLAHFYFTTLPFTTAPHASTVGFFLSPPRFLSATRLSLLPPFTHRNPPPLFLPSVSAPLPPEPRYTPIFPLPSGCFCPSLFPSHLFYLSFPGSLFRFFLNLVGTPFTFFFGGLFHTHFCLYCSTFSPLFSSSPFPPCVRALRFRTAKTTPSVPIWFLQYTP